MLDSRDIGGLQGAPLHGADNEKIGSVAQVFVDPETGSPNWVTIKTGFLGRHESFVPLANATWDGEILRTDLDRETVLEAPRLNADEGLSPHNEEALNRYFGLSDVDTDGGTARAPEDYPERPELMEQAAARRQEEEASAADYPVDVTPQAAPAQGMPGQSMPGQEYNDASAETSTHPETAAATNAPADGSEHDTDARRQSTPVPYDDVDPGTTNTARPAPPHDGAAADARGSGDTADVTAPPRKGGPRHAANRDTAV